MGSWRGSLAGISDGKEKVYLGSFLGTRGHKDFKTGGHLNLGKGTGIC